MLIDGQLCPEHLKISIRRYRDHHVRCGDFLRSVIANDVHQAVLRADLGNLSLLAHIVAFVLSELPVRSYGSYENVDRWENVHPLIGDEPEAGGL